VWGIEPSADLRGDGHLVADAAFVEHLGDALFAEPVAVDVRGVEEVDPGVERGPDGLSALLFGDVAPVAADVPRPEADVRYLVASGSQLPSLHGRGYAGGTLVPVAFGTVDGDQKRAKRPIAWVAGTCRVADGSYSTHFVRRTSYPPQSGQE
jgi:hypothetical protein